MKNTNHENIHYFSYSDYKTSDLYLISCGHHKYDPNYSYDHGIPTAYHLHIILKGKGACTINNQTKILTSNDIFLIPKGIPVSYKTDALYSWKYIWFTFDGKTAYEFLKMTKLKNSYTVIYSTVRSTDYISFLVHMLTTKDDCKSSYIARIGYLYELLARIIKNLSINEESKKEGLPIIIIITTTTNHIKNNLNINRSYLTSIFIKYLNTSPIIYFLSYRMSIASTQY